MLRFLSLANNQSLTSCWIKTRWRHTNRDKVRAFRIIIIAQHGTCGDERVYDVVTIISVHDVLNVVIYPFDQLLVMTYHCKVCQTIPRYFFLDKIF